jgi:hypothetical protein
MRNVGVRGLRRLHGRQVAHVAAAAAMTSGVGTLVSLVATSQPAGATATSGYLYGGANQGGVYYCNKATVAASGTQPEFSTGIESGTSICSSNQNLNPYNLGAAVWGILNGTVCGSSGYYENTSTESIYGFTEPMCGGQHGYFQSWVNNEYWNKNAQAWWSSGTAESPPEYH